MGRLRSLCLKDTAPTRSGGRGDFSSPAGILEAASSPPLEHGISDFGYLSSPDPSKMTVFVPMLITAVDIAVKHICKIFWSILTEPQ